MMDSRGNIWDFLLLLAVLILVGCESVQAQAPAPLPAARLADAKAAQPTPAPSLTVPDQVQAARAAALRYLSQHQGAPTPAVGLNWVVKYATPEGRVGGATYVFAAGDWTVTLSCLSTYSPTAVYHVLVINRVDGFQWAGQVDTTGQVAEFSPSG